MFRLFVRRTVGPVEAVLPRHERARPSLGKFVVPLQLPAINHFGKDLDRWNLVRLNAFQIAVISELVDQLNKRVNLLVGETPEHVRKQRNRLSLPRGERYSTAFDHRKACLIRHLTRHQIETAS